MKKAISLALILTFLLGCDPVKLHVSGSRSDDDLEDHIEYIDGDFDIYLPPLPDGDWDPYFENQIETDVYEIADGDQTEYVNGDIDYDTATEIPEFEIDESDVHEYEVDDTDPDLETIIDGDHDHDRHELDIDFYDNLETSDGDQIEYQDGDLDEESFEGFETEPDFDYDIFDSVELDNGYDNDLYDISDSDRFDNDIFDSYDGYDSFDSSDGYDLQEDFEESINHRPVALDTSVTGPANQTLVTDVSGYDPDEDMWYIHEVGVPRFGWAEHTPNVVRYTPITNFCGNDAFEFRIIDEHGLESNRAMLYITIECDKK